ncbi:MAG: F0F1 ATP synthase subunit epsilon [Rhodospirillaceae bacterium]|nr:F0F1 ATP synthase subunit epsilon [Rhodospirillaceae bacterium]
MHLKVLLPTRVLVDTEIAKVSAEAANGAFTLLPRHIDFVASLVPGILTYQPTDGAEAFLAVDEGILVKCGDEVLISTRRAAPGDDLHALRDRVEQTYLHLDEHERLARSALARLEAGVVRRFMDLA